MAISITQSFFSGDLDAVFTGQNVLEIYSRSNGNLAIASI
jgi:hypothetical protein